MASQSTALGNNRKTHKKRSRPARQRPRAAPHKHAHKHVQQLAQSLHASDLFGGLRLMIPRLVISAGPEMHLKMVFASQDEQSEDRRQVYSDASDSSDFPLSECGVPIEDS